MVDPAASPEPPIIGGWGVRRKVQYTGRKPQRDSQSSTDTASSEPPPPVPATAAPKRKKTASATAVRWSKERYAMAETKLVEIMHQMGARVGSPIGRHTVREEARKHIGDTGLLDHLLKHMVGELVGDCSVRLRRRHNAEGAMEYWLEPGEWAEMRRDAGVKDPFWVPPPGWKRGDGTAPCPCGEECDREASKLGEEVAAVKRDYESLMEWKNRAEEEMVSMSSSLQVLKQEMMLMREEKRRKASFSGTCHSSVLNRT